ncbi:MAG TPA: hypothetical protein VGQ06_07980 [Gemmatimonadales bacterium]|jgi:hypothetical protein|nr:hypothetical protein [Gemmatimonadales bacterium]
MLAPIRALSVAALFSAALATPAFAKPPWISIEYPVNPYDASLRGAYLVVHTFIHRSPMSLSLDGTAEGIVNGERRTIRLEFTAAAQPGVYALRQLWPAEGVWTLVIRAANGPGNVATALVEIGADGEIAAVKVPTRRQGDTALATDVAMADIDRALRARASALARRD